MLKGPPRHPPCGGLGGRSVPRVLCSALNPRKAWSASFACKPRDGGAGAPARGLRSGRCTPGGAPTQELNMIATRGSVPRRPRGTTAWMQEVEQRMEQLPRTPSVWSHGTTVERSRRGKAVPARRGGCVLSIKRRDGRTVRHGQRGVLRRGVSGVFARGLL